MDYIVDGVKILEIMKHEPKPLPCEKCYGSCCGKKVHFSKKDLKRIQKKYTSLIEKLKIYAVQLDKKTFQFESDLESYKKDWYCIFYDKNSNKCLIYEERPQVCRMYGKSKLLLCPFEGMDYVPEKGSAEEQDLVIQTQIKQSQTLLGSFNKLANI